jgi:hypothetical protein
MTTEAEMLERWKAAANDIALVFAHEPPEQVDAQLAGMREKLIAQFREIFPKASPETIAAGVDCILAEIQKRRREIEEAAGTMPRVLN